MENKEVFIHKNGMKVDINDDSKNRAKSMIIIPIVITISFIVIAVTVVSCSMFSVTNTDLAKITYQEYTAVNTPILKLEERYTDSDGYISEENLQKVIDEVVQQAEKYKRKGLIKKYNVEDLGVSMNLPSGALYFYQPTLKNMAAGGGIKEIVTVEPGSDRLELNIHKRSDHSPDYLAKKAAQTFPTAVSFSDNIDELKISDIKRLLSKKSVILWYGHGGYLEEYGSVLSVTDKPTIKNQEAYISHINAEEIIIGKDNLLITNKYIDNNFAPNAFKDCLIYLGSCSSAKDDRLSEAFLRKGAALVVGNSKPIYVGYNLDMMCTFFSTLLKVHSNDGSFYTAEEALEEAKNKHGKTDSSIISCQAEVRLIYPSDHTEPYRLFGKNKSSAPTNSNKKDTTPVRTDNDNNGFGSNTNDDSNGKSDNNSGEELNKGQETSPTKASNPDSPKINQVDTELSKYMFTNIYDFVNAMGNMYDVHATSEIEYRNDYLIVSSGVEDRIFFISIENSCEYTLNNIKYGMDFDQARLTMQIHDYKLVESTSNRLHYRNDFEDFIICSDDGNNVSNISLQIYNYCKGVE